VEIGKFLPECDVLSPKVVNADEEIGPGDDVMVRGEKAFGVGRARMSGWEMVRSTKGDGDGAEEGGRGLNEMVSASSKNRSPEGLYLTGVSPGEMMVGSEGSDRATHE
jgi:tRNA-archaeosine synthase